MWNKIQRIYVGDHYQVYPKWKPWSNTVAYYPLTSDVKDYSWNWKNWTLNWSGSSYTWLWIKLTTSSYITLPTMGSLTTPTFSIWVNVTSASQFKNGEYYYNSAWKTWIWIWFWTVSGSTNARPHWFIWNGSGEKNVYTAADKAPWTRNHYLITYNGSTAYFYINWVLNKSETYGLSSSNLNTYNWYINGNNGSLNQHGSWVFSDCIVESAYWTATEVADYFNQTKATYLWFN